MIRHLGFRRWIAWKLVQLAHRIYDATWYERIVVRGKDGSVVHEFEVSANSYGDGVISSVGRRYFGDYQVDWEDYAPDWLDEE